jgi:hypothetical protein
MEMRAHMKSALLFGPADKKTALTSIRAYIVPAAGPKIDKDLFYLLFFWPLYSGMKQSTSLRRLLTRERAIIAKPEEKAWRFSR